MTSIAETSPMTRFLALAAACLLAASCDGGPTGPGDGGGRDVPQRYTVVPIEVPAGTASPGVGPAAINASGQVLLGTFYMGRTFTLWSGGGATTFTAPHLAFATGVNDAGQVVGCTGNAFGDGEQRPLLGEAGGLWYLAGTGLERACARDINNDGVVVGEAGPSQRSRAFVLAGGRVTLVDVPGDTASRAVAVNGSGHVAVNSLRTLRSPTPNVPSGVGQASLWRNGRLEPLGSLDWPAAGPGRVADPARFIHSATDLNDRDQVVGTSIAPVCTPDGFSCTTRQRAFLWRAGKMTDLGSGRPDDNSNAVAINRWGHVLVQVYTRTGAEPFLWHEGRLLDLNEALAGTGWRITVVHDLNDAGQVLATAQRTGGGAAAAVRLDPA
jgi:uncharacterized membrane protein